MSINNKNNKQNSIISLRELKDSDLDLFFKFQIDPESNYMAAFTTKNPNDRANFDAHWTKIRSNPDIITRTILYNDTIVGHISKFIEEGKAEITYWIGKDFWRKGIATHALNQFLLLLEIRPLYARVAKDNIGSNRVLEKCGFRIIGENKDFANGRNQETEEYIRILE